MVCVVSTISGINERRVNKWCKQCCLVRKTKPKGFLREESHAETDLSGLLESTGTLGLGVASINDEKWATPPLQHLQLGPAT